MFQCKFGVMHFFVTKTASPLVDVLLRPMGLYYERKFNLKSSFIYILVFLNISMGWEMYCLVKLFLTTKEDLQPPQYWCPIGGLFCIKGVVFFKFWQGFVPFLLSNPGVIRSMGE